MKLIRIAFMSLLSAWAVSAHAAEGSGKLKVDSQAERLQVERLKNALLHRLGMNLVAECAGSGRQVTIRIDSDYLFLQCKKDWARASRTTLKDEGFDIIEDSKKEGSFRLVDKVALDAAGLSTDDEENTLGRVSIDNFLIVEALLRVNSENYFLWRRVKAMENLLKMQGELDKQGLSLIWEIIR